LISRPGLVYSAAKLDARIAAMGRSISRRYAGRTLDVVVILENAFVFAADLVRHISIPVVCHFVRSELRDIELSGYARTEVFFSHAPQLKGKDVLLVDAVLRTGVTLDFLAKRLLESRPRSLRIAVLVDEPEDRRVDLHPDYFGFVGASKQLVGYGLAGRQGHYRNLAYVGMHRETSSGKRVRGARRAGSRRSGPKVR
jgi:hypoxanthine phosphoribosyltransferase